MDDRETDASNVIDIADAKKTEAEKTKKRVVSKSGKDKNGSSQENKDKKKIPIARLYAAVAANLSHHPASVLRIKYGAVDRTFVTARMGRAGIRPLLVTDEDLGICQLQPDLDEVCHTIARYISRNLHELDDYQWTPSHVDACAKYWRLTAAPYPEPAATLWADEPGYCFQRLPWRRGVTGAIDLWLEILGRMGDESWQRRCQCGEKPPIEENSQAMTFVYFLASLFDHGSDRQQYLYIQGEGQDSKGTIGRIIRKLFGNAYAALLPIERDSARFFASQLIGARIGVFSDFDRPEMLSTGMWKSLTGDDPVSVEFKGKTPYTDMLHTKFIFLSQNTPLISTQHADLRRILLIRMARYEGPLWSSYERELWDQTGAFITWCMEHWEAYKALHKTTALPSSRDYVAEVVASTLESDHQDFVDTHLIFSPSHWTAAADLNRRIRDHFSSRREQIAFKEWLKRTYGVSEQRAYPQEKDRTGKSSQQRVYLGVKLRQFLVHQD